MFGFIRQTSLAHSATNSENSIFQIGIKLVETTRFDNSCPRLPVLSTALASSSFISSEKKFTCSHLNMPISALARSPTERIFLTPNLSDCIFFFILIRSCNSSFSFKYTATAVTSSKKSSAAACLQEIQSAHVLWYMCWHLRTFLFIK